jgi:hypothetical protein
MRRYTRVAVYRFSQEWNVEEALQFGREQEGKGYNFAFLFNDKSFYCSQLLYRVFLAGGVELAKPRANRMGYPIVNPDELIYDNRERLELIWSAGHEIFRDKGEAMLGISKMTGHMVLSVLAEKGVVLGKQALPLNDADASDVAKTKPVAAIRPRPALALVRNEDSEDLASDETLPMVS